ncbi:MAG: HAD hydrolase-like protein [Fibrobacteres bacterium]|jgi:phosphoglycolate phosphatase|nr:HAD hydrolase-like protein [Fibrobacterota bacterium]
MIRHVVFDLDGTLVHSAPDVLASLSAALTHAGVAYSVPIPESVIGPPVKGMIERMGVRIDPGQMDVAVAAFRASYDPSPMLLTFPYPGADELLARLKQRNLRVYLATNKPTEPTKRLVERFFKGMVDDICCVDGIPGRRLSKREMLEELAARHAIAPDEAVMVGDGAVDIGGGRQVGWTTIAVRWGYGTIEELENESPSIWAGTLGEIARLLEDR